MERSSPSYLARIVDAIVARLSVEPRYPEENRVPIVYQTLAGVHVTPDRAQQNDVVAACKRYLSQTVAQLPVRVMKMRPDGTSERVVSHSVDYLMNWRPNPELAPFQLKETLTGWALIWGNGYAEIGRDGGGRAVALWPIHPERVEVRRDADTDALVYRVSNGGGGYVDLDAADMFHLRGFGDGPVGISVIEYAVQAIGWAQATQLFGAAFFGNGLNHQIAIEGAGSLKSTGQKRLEAEIKARHGGPMKAFKALFLDNGMKVTKTSATPDEAQFIETMQLQVEIICRLFGVPPHKVAHLLRSTYGNIEHQAIEVVTDSIAPWAIRWEEEVNYKLFPAAGSGRAGRLYVKLDLKGLLRGDFKTRQEGLKIMRDEGIITAAEWRDLEDMGPMPADAGGDKYIVAANMTELKRLGQSGEQVTP